jgi:hypothetical protein
LDNSFLSIPQTAFHLEEDQINFEAEIRDLKLRKRTLFWQRLLVFFVSIILHGTG